MRHRSNPAAHAADLSSPPAWRNAGIAVAAGLLLTVPVAQAAPSPSLSGSFSMRVATTTQQENSYSTITGPISGSLSKSEFYDGNLPSYGVYGSVTSSAAVEGFVGRPALQPQAQNLSIGLYAKSTVSANGNQSLGGSSFASIQTSVNVPFTVIGGQNGTAGTMQLRLRLEGDVAVTPYRYTGAGETTYGGAEMYFWATGLGATGCDYYVDSACWAEFKYAGGDIQRFNNPNRTWLLNIPFVFGQEGSFYMQMWADSRSYANAWGGNGNGTGLAEHSATVDYLNTAALDGVVGVLDSQGRPVAGWSVTTVDGFDLNARAPVPSAVPAPVPVAALLLGLGIAVLRRPQLAEVA